ncbi:hypothetical protein E6R60_26595 [Streptomyces sp. A0642]|uniref:hypothetical protein n=1 Tax=Streptomyces sp. A0642 TaxID=2563100 RepID=UPI0010A209AE|nr:hypothetical protein [Streptomyces sp. A0642]THA72502.1 hypothetical protein E6R60_26595 [Streptomyces sp. A0642]
MASTDAQRLAEEDRMRRETLLTAWEGRDLGPEITAVARIAKGLVQEVLHARRIKNQAAKIRAGKAKAESIGGNLVYSSYFDYEAVYQASIYVYSGARSALKAALMAQHQELTELEAESLADHLSGRPAPPETL